MPKVKLTMDGETLADLETHFPDGLSPTRAVQSATMLACKSQEIRFSREEVTVVINTPARFMSRKKIIVEAIFETGEGTYVPLAKQVAVRDAVLNALDKLFTELGYGGDVSITVEPKPTVQFARL